MLRKLSGLFAIFLAFYLGAHFYIRWRNTITDDVTKIGRLVECQPNDVRAVRFRQSAEGQNLDFSFERLDQPEPGVPALVAVARWRWKMSAPVSGEADPAVIRRIASTFCELYDPIPVRPSDWHPETLTRRLGRTLAVTLTGAAEAHVEFGAFTDSATVIRYSGLGGDRTVRIPDHLLQAVSLPVEDYRNRRVMRTDADNVQEAVLTVGGKERFTLDRAGADWKVLVAGKERGDASDEAGKFVNRMASLLAIGIDGEGLSAQECKALKATAVVTVRDVAGRPEEVRFQYGKGGDVTACSSLGSQRLHVHRDLIPYLDVPVKAVLGRNP